MRLEGQWGPRKLRMDEARQLGRPPAPTSNLGKLLSAAKSGFRRYPRAIVESVRRPFAGRSPSVLTARHRPPILDPHPLAAMWLGHATVFVRLCGLNILMDPVFSDRIGVNVGGMTIGLPRLAPFPLNPEHLPPIDVILISHAHFDHLDRPTLQSLVSGSTTVITARRTKRLIPPGFARVIELDWDQDMIFRGIHIAAMRPAHWGARTALDRRRGYNSYILREAKDRQGVLLAGDTAMTDAFNSLDDLTLAVFGIGSYEPWEHAHATPEQAWSMFQGSRATHLLPVHHSTFELGDEPEGEPMRRLLAAADGSAHQVILAEPGAVWAA